MVYNIYITKGERDSSTYPAGIGLRVKSYSQRVYRSRKLQGCRLKTWHKTTLIWILESSATTIEGNPAHKIEFTATDDKEEKHKAM